MKFSKTALIFLLDIFIINLIFCLSFYFYSSFDDYIRFYPSLLFFLIVNTVIKISSYYFFSLYKSIWEYASIEELIRVVLAVTFSSLLTFTFLFFLFSYMDFEVLLVIYSFEIILIGSNRFVYRIFRRIKYNKSIIHQEDSKRILVIGSGSTASLVATEIKTHPGRYGRLIGFIDEDTNKVGNYLAGVKICGTHKDIVKIAQKHRVNEIILAIPTATRIDTREILESCALTSAKVTIVPGIVEIIDGKVSLQKARPVKIEDLLGRGVVDLHVQEVSNYINGKTILVTGGAGSIGSELCRQLIKLNPKKLIIVDFYENSIYDLQNEFASDYPSYKNVLFLIASIREKDSVFSLISRHLPDVIFHAAAHKHVPLMEDSPKEAIKNNVFGTLNVAEAAHNFNVKHFVLISSDKAVNPSSVMGATKRICEMIIQAIDKVSLTKFVAVRFGNVLGSNGSVVPLFERQLKEGLPITVTHKDVVRYFMTIPEASQLVIQAGAIAKGGEIFVLDMGEPIRIYDLALKLIRLSGLKPYEDINIIITGLRPGEKLYEELLMDEEGLTSTDYRKIHIGFPQQINFQELNRKLHLLKQNLSNYSDAEIVSVLQEFVPSFKHNSGENGV